MSGHGRLRRATCHRPWTANAANLLSIDARFQPIAGAHFGEVIAAKLPVDPWLPMAGLEEADHKELIPVSGLSRSRN